MIYKQNLHTHSTYCDGKNSLEEMVIEAIKKGFNSIGFSGHSYMQFKDSPYSMSLEDTANYKKDIKDLQKKYQGVIDIYLGLEFERYSEIDLTGYDYIIGSVHYLYQDGLYLGVDTSLQCTRDSINNHFNGNGLLYAKKYYETVMELTNALKIDIVGHFDVLTKFNEKEYLIDEDSQEYKNYALEALHEISKCCDVFEVNTGAISRGYRTTPYLAPFILKELKNLNCKLVLSSDCHDKNFLDCHFKETINYIKSNGFNELYFFNKGKFVGEKI